MADQVRLEFVVIDKTGAAISKAKGQINGLNKSLGDTNKFAKRVAGALAAIGTAAVVRGLINTIRTFEDLRATLVTIEGSTQAAGRAFELIKEFTAGTTFQLDEVTNAFITLRNAGLSPTSEFMTDVGNIAAGMGKRLDDVAKAVFNATTGEFEMLKQLGIKVRTEGDKLRVTFKGTTKEIMNDGISIVKLVQEIGRTEFKGGIERSSKTLSGAFSNLQDAVAIAANEIGEGGLTAALTDVTREITAATLGTQNLARDIGEGLGNAILFVKNNIDLLIVAFKLLALGFLVKQVFALKVAMAGLGVTVANVTKAIRLMTAAAMANPLIAAATVLVGGIVLFKDQLKEVAQKFGILEKETNKATEATNDFVHEMSEAIPKTEAQIIAEKQAAAQKEKLEKATNDYVKKLDEEIRKLEAAKQPTEAMRRLYEMEHGVLKGINNETRERIRLKLEEIESEKQLAAAKKALPGIAKEVGGVLAERFPEVEAEKEKLAQLKRLKDEGILTEREYSIAIKKIQDNRARDAIAARKKEVEDVIDLIKTGQVKTNDIEALSGKQRVQLAKSIGLEVINVLGQYSEKAFKIAKAAAIAEAIVSTAQGIANALKVLPFPLNLAAAALVAAKGYAQVQQIRSTQYTGPRQKGGAVGQNQSYLVGESGPEIFRPNTAGTIIPNNQMGGAVTVNFNIETVDATGFDELLVERRSTIVGIINQAFNRQGRQGVTT